MPGRAVSMKSGLEGRNNSIRRRRLVAETLPDVSMKSGLEGRNNPSRKVSVSSSSPNLPDVSMKSGLEGRNNSMARENSSRVIGLNEVRPRRPEQ